MAIPTGSNDVRRRPSQEAGSPTQPASLSSLDFPMCFHEQCTSCQGHCEAGPPSLGTLQGSSSCTGAPLCRSRCYSLLMWALGWCWRCAFCMGIWCVCSISVRSGGDSSAAVPCCFPGWHIQLYVRGRQAGEIQKKCLERGWPCQLLAFSHFQLGWDRVHSLL